MIASNPQALWTWAVVWQHIEANPIGWSSVIMLFLSPLFIHELGHWVALKLYRIPILETGIGFGPRLFRIKGFAVRPILFGAYVIPVPETFRASGSYKRLVAAVAGPAANFLYAAILMLVVAARHGQYGNTGLLAVAVLSAALGVINLIPVPPLDGWVILENFLDIMGKPLSPTASDMARRLGSGLVYGLAALFILWLVHPTPILNALF